MGGLWNLLTLEQLQRLSDEEITRRVNDLLAPAGIGNPFIAQPVDFIAAQFYVSELDRRETRRTNVERDRIETRRHRVDLGIELSIVVLIGVEIFLGIQAGHQQTKDAAAQIAALQSMQTVLGQMEITSATTAKTMTTLEATTEMMNGSLQKQVALFYDVQVNVVYNENTKKLMVINSGRTNISLWSQRVGDEGDPVLTYKKPDIVPPTGTYEIALGDTIKTIAAVLPKDQTHPYTFTFLVMNEKQEKFTVNGDLIAVWRGETITFNIPNVSLVPGWNKK